MMQAKYQRQSDAIRCDQVQVCIPTNEFFCFVSCTLKRPAVIRHPGRIPLSLVAFFHFSDFLMETFAMLVADTAEVGLDWKKSRWACRKCTFKDIRHPRIRQFVERFSTKSLKLLALWLPKKVSNLKLLHAVTSLSVMIVSNSESDIACLICGSKKMLSRSLGSLICVKILQK